MASTLLYYISGPTGTAIAETKQSLLSDVTTLCFGTSVVEQPPNQDGGITHHLPQKTEDTCSDFTSTCMTPPPQKKK